MVLVNEDVGCDPVEDIVLDRLIIDDASGYLPHMQTALVYFVLQ